MKRDKLDRYANLTTAAMPIPHGAPPLRTRDSCSPDGHIMIATEDAGADIRPGTLAEYIGQDAMKGALRVAVQAARMQGRPLDHALFYGPPGLGKTTIALALAHEMGTEIRITSGPAIERPGEIAAVCSSLRPRDVLFIDEIHRLPRAVEEVLYPAMEDGRLDVIVGVGQDAHTLRLRLPPFTLIGATTRFGLVTAPLRDRFGHIHRLEYYSPIELAMIVTRSAGILGAPLEPAAAEEIAMRSRGTPRIANRLLARSWDHAQVEGDGRITGAIARRALAALQIDAKGLDGLDRALLRSIIVKFSGGPVGLATLAASVNEDAGTVSEVVEPYLQSIGFVARTPRGRVATALAYAHMNGDGAAFPS